MSRERVVVMAREPRPGAVKTRLAAAIGEYHAAALYEAFLADTIDTCRTAGLVAMISYARDAASAATYFNRAFPRIRCTPQPDADFGARLASAMHAGFASGARRVAIVGSDIPHIAPDWLAQAFTQLGESDLVLGPTLDGGYYLIAMNSPWPTVFEDIDWSSGREFAQTLERAAALNLRVALTETTFDIDDQRDLAHLLELIARDGPSACPSTARTLAKRALEPETRSRAEAR